MVKLFNGVFKVIRSYKTITILSLHFEPSCHLLQYSWSEPIDIIWELKTSRFPSFLPETARTNLYIAHIVRRERNGIMIVQTHIL